MTDREGNRTDNDEAHDDFPIVQELLRRRCRGEVSLVDPLNPQRTQHLDEPTPAPKASISVLYDRVDETAAPLFGSY